MDKNVILAKKYGRAIYEIAAEQNSLEKTEEELHLIADAIKEHADLKELLFHPLLAKDVKKDTIKKLFADKVQPVVLQFCYVVIDRDRITDGTPTAPESTFMGKTSRSTPWSAARRE